MKTICLICVLCLAKVCVGQTKSESWILKNSGSLERCSIQPEASKDRVEFHDVEILLRDGSTFSKVAPKQLNREKTGVSKERYNVTVYPNPVQDQFMVRTVFDSERIVVLQNFSFELYDATGKLKLKKSLKGEYTPVSSDFLTPGLYVWRVLALDGSLVSKGKLVVQ